MQFRCDGDLALLKACTQEVALEKVTPSPSLVRAFWGALEQREGCFKVAGGTERPDEPLVAGSVGHDAARIHTLINLEGFRSSTHPRKGVKQAGVCARIELLGGEGCENPARLVNLPFAPENRDSLVSRFNIFAHQVRYCRRIR